jgi:hypothetical protein
MMYTEIDSHQLTTSRQGLPASLWRNLVQAAASQLCTATFLVTSEEIGSLDGFFRERRSGPLATA